MRFDVISLFPNYFDVLRSSQIWKRAEENGQLLLETHDLRAFASDRHRTVDDVPYGGGAGMVLKVEPLVAALESIPRSEKSCVLLASPQGRRFDQEWARKLSIEYSQLIIVSGRYEGVDERFIEAWVDETFSIGDYVLSGGELPAMVFIDTIARLVPGVVGDEASVLSDTFSSGTLKYPQYTRPSEFRGYKVPPVLLSGNHEMIRQWRSEQSWRRTEEKRPDLVAAFHEEAHRAELKGFLRGNLEREKGK